MPYNCPHCYSNTQLPLSMPQNFFGEYWCSTCKTVYLLEPCLINGQFWSFGLREKTLRIKTQKDFMRKV